MNIVSFCSFGAMGASFLRYRLPWIQKIDTTRKQNFALLRDELSIFWYIYCLLNVDIVRDVAC